MTTWLVFLSGNGRWVEVDWQSLYNLTVWVAQSPAELKDEVVTGIDKFTKIHWVTVKSNKAKKAGDA